MTYSDITMGSDEHGVRLRPDATSALSFGSCAELSDSEALPLIDSRVRARAKLRALATSLRGSTDPQDRYTATQIERRKPYGAFVDYVLYERLPNQTYRRVWSGSASISALRVWREDDPRRFFPVFRGRAPKTGRSATTVATASLDQVLAAHEGTMESLTAQDYSSVQRRPGFPYTAIEECRAEAEERGDSAVAGVFDSMLQTGETMRRACADAGLRARAESFYIRHMA